MELHTSFQLFHSQLWDSTVRSGCMNPAIRMLL